jgi:hypothetical protein
VISTSFDTPSPQSACSQASGWPTCELQFFIAEEGITAAAYAIVSVVGDVTHALSRSATIPAISTRRVAMCSKKKTGKRVSPVAVGLRR